MPRQFDESGELRGVRTIAPKAPLPLDRLPTEEGEEWRYLVTTDAYAVSNHGRLARTLPAKGTHIGRIIKAKPAGRGREAYPVHCLSIGNEREYHPLRRLVYEAFVGPIPSSMEVATRDGDGKNVRPDNLILVDRGLSGIAAAGDGMLKRRGERSPVAKLTNAAVREIRAAPADVPNTVLATRFDVKPETVGSARRRKHWPEDGSDSPAHP